MKTPRADFTWCGWHESLSRPECRTANHQKTIELKEVVHVKDTWAAGNCGREPYPYQRSAPVHPWDWGTTSANGHTPLAEVVPQLRQREIDRERFRIHQEARRQHSPVGAFWGVHGPW
jgi:hypothetical protein